MKKSKTTYSKTLAVNKKAKFSFTLEESFEAGIMLLGSEVKSLRGGRGNISESYACEEGGEIFLINAHIAQYFEANRENHFPTRKRKLLLHKRQIRRIIGKISQSGYTLVPTKIYVNDRNLIKIEIALGKGKNLRDKRDTIRNREWNIQKSRMLKGDM